MTYFVYVSVKGEDKINVYSMDDAGSLELKHEVALAGGPSGIALAPNRGFLYVALRDRSELASLSINRLDGSISLLGSIEEESDSVYITVDRSGKFVLTSSNGGARASSYRVGENGALVAPAASTVHTLQGAHSVEVHPSNRFVYVPHCIRQNAIFQYKYDPETGEFVPQELAILVPQERLGPRHIRFHPTLDVMYTTDEQGNSITAYPVRKDGRLSFSFQTISTLPDGYDGSNNTTAQLRIHPSGRFLYAPNRGHDSISCFRIDEISGELSLIGRVPGQAHVRGFDIDSRGKFIFAAGVESGKMSTYRVDQGTGELSEIETYEVGIEPMWVLVAEL